MSLCVEDLPEVKAEQTLSWNNQDNNAFYESLNADGLRQFAEKAGLISCCDMEALTPYWSDAQSILEVGAGYGRVIGYLLKNNFQGKITAIERCSALMKHLTSNYGQSVNLLHFDVSRCYQIDHRFDVILFLWSGLADFAREEQLLLIQKLATLLSAGGKLIIDSIPPHVTPLETIPCGKQTYSIKAKNQIIRTYSPSEQDIRDYAAQAGLHHVTYVSCITDTQRERWLYILS